MNMTIKELRKTCDDLYYRFALRVSQIIESETINEAERKVICLYIDKNHDDCISITRWNDDDIWFWLDDFNGLLIGTADDHDLIDVRLNRVLGPKRDFKRYTSTISDKPLHQKKRAILLELKTKLETLLKDYL